MPKTAKRRLSLGPGMLVTAAFVGPGTIATASAAGAGFGYALVWALAFSVAATIILQEMSVRQAIVTGQGLAPTLRGALRGRWFGPLLIALLIAAIGLGNAAYESGNIAGAAVALASVSTLGGERWAILIGLTAAALTAIPAYRVLEKILVSLVLMMSVVFVLCAVILRPDWGALATGLFRPALPSASLTTVIALIGTTVVPYNLFLQASAVHDRWGAERDKVAALQAARWDTGLSVAIGGLITLSLVSIAASSFFAQGLEFAPELLADQLEPVLGSAGRVVFATGLFAAGLTSAVTAPLAAAYTVCGALGYRDALDGRVFRLTAGLVIAIGTVFAATGSRPLALIVFAQAANGLLLPIVCALLIWLMNQRGVLGDARNGLFSNLLGAFVLLVTLGLSGSKLLSLLGL